MRLRLSHGSLQSWLFYTSGKRRNVISPPPPPQVYFPVFDLSPFYVIPSAAYYLMGIIIYESWICLLWNIASEARPFSGWSPYDGTAQHVRGKRYKLGLASVRIRAWRPARCPACFTCSNKANDVMSGESSPLYQVWQFSSLHPSGLPVSLPLHSVSSSCWCFRALFFTGTLSWIKSFMAISIISSWEGRKPTHTLFWLH